MEKAHKNGFMSSSPRYPKERLFEGSQALSACPSGKSYIEMKFIIEHWWKETKGEKWVKSEGNLSQHYFVTINLTWTGQRSNSGFRDERLIS
jgi:hypothetical protein